MKRIILVFATLVIAAPLFAAVHFGNVDVNVGDTWTEQSGYGSDVTVAIDNSMGVHNPAGIPPGQYQQQQTKAISRTKNVLVTAVQGPKISGLQVEYTNVTINGVDQTGLFSGKQYAIDINGNHINTVSIVGGGTPTDDELNFVTKDNSNVGQLRELRRVFGGETVEIGDTLHSQHPDDLIDTTAGFTVDNFEATLASVTGDGDNQVATFNVTLSISNEVKRGHPNDQDSPFSSSHVHFDLAGPMDVKVSTARIQTFSFTGPASVSGNKVAKGKDKHGNDVGGIDGNGNPRQMSVTASGNANMSANFTY